MTQSRRTGQWTVRAGRIFLLLAIGACSGKGSPTAPGAPELAGFALTPMGVVAPAQPITLQVEAIGTDGSRPYTAFNGDVTLTADRGVVTPDHVTLTNGVGNATVQLSVADGVVQITAATGAASGKTTIALTALSILPGAPSDPVEMAIPDLAFEPRGPDYDTNDPELPGIPISFNTMGIVFAMGTTVGQANAILTTLGATIAGGIPGVVGQAPGILMVRTNSTDHVTMAAQLQQLEADPLVRLVTEDWLLATMEQPQPNGGTPGEWKWEVTPAGGNWGLERARVPAVWNLNPTLERGIKPSIPMGIIDNGMTGHADFPSFADLTPAQVEDHGMHVAGIMGAIYDNGLGVDGVCPYATFITVSEDTLSELWQNYALHQIMKQNPQTKVVNVSLGIDWCAGTINPGASAGAQQRTNAKGALCEVTYSGLRTKGRAPLLTVAAGNQSDCGLGLVDAIWAGGWANAALGHLTPEILVVENVQRDGGSPGGATRLASSNIGGHLSAPGTGILSTVRGGYGVKSGTSMAAPFVAGLIGYLYALDPALSQAQIKQLLIDNAFPVGGGAADCVDAAATVLAVDAVQGSDAVLRRLVDIDDGTEDGNLRINPTAPIMDYTQEDADGNQGPGDGRIDMADFRRWRDWLLDAEANPDRSLNGSPQHPKRDLNGNGDVEAAAAENIWPRGDFNCDGRLSRTEGSAMPGFLGGDYLTDLEVLQRLFDDPDVSAAELPGLIESGDIHLDLDSFLAQPEVVSARVQVLDGITQVQLLERVFASSHGDHVLTVAAGLSLYALQVEGLDGSGSVVCTVDRDFTLAPCEDFHILVECTNVVVDVQLPQVIDATAPSPLLVRAGVRSGSTVQYQAGLQVAILATGSTVASPMGVTDANGYFGTEVTPNDGTQQTTVFVTVTNPADGQSATVSASAQVQAMPPPSVLLHVKNWISAGCSTPASSPSQEIVRENQLVFIESLDFTSEWTCPEDPNKIGKASASSNTDTQLQLEPTTNYVKRFDLTGEMMTAGEANVEGGSCYGVFNISTGAHTGDVLELQVLDEPGALDLDGTLQLEGSSAMQIQVWKADNPLFKDPTKAFELVYRDEAQGAGEVPVAGTLDLNPGRFYRVEIQSGTGSSNFNETTSFETSVKYDLHLSLRKTAPSKGSHAIRLGTNLRMIPR